MSRKKMFIPSNFTVADNTRVEFRNCTLYTHTGLNMLHANIYKDHFQGDVLLDELDIYTEDDKVVFLDKFEAYITQGERLL